MIYSECINGYRHFSSYSNYKYDYRITRRSVSHIHIHILFYIGIATEGTYLLYLLAWVKLLILIRVDRLVVIIIHA